MSLSIRSAPQDENAHAVRMAPAKAGLTARGGGLQQQSGPLKPQQQQAAGLGKPGAVTEKRRALGDITNSAKLGGGGSGSGGLGGLKGKALQSSVVASTRPLAAPPAARQPTKLSAPIQLVSALPPLPSAAAASSDMSWMEVEGAKGDGRRPDSSDEDELTAATSRALLRVMPQGKELFSCRPQSPIPWERSKEEDAYNGQQTRTDQTKLRLSPRVCTRSLSPSLSHRSLTCVYGSCSYADREAAESRRFRRHRRFRPAVLTRSRQSRRLAARPLAPPSFCTYLHSTVPTSACSLFHLSLFFSFHLRAAIRSSDLAPPSRNVALALPRTHAQCCSAQSAGLVAPRANAPDRPRLSPRATCTCIASHCFMHHIVR